MNNDTTSARRPMYGYLRVLPKLDDQAVSRLTHELFDFAEQAGFTLLEVFVEEHWPQFTALDALYFHCQTNGVHSGQVWIMWPEVEETSCLLGTPKNEGRP